MYIEMWRVGYGQFFRSVEEPESVAAVMGKGVVQD
jgi:hypothetical protein